MNRGRDGKKKTSFLGSYTKAGREAQRKPLDEAAFRLAAERREQEKELAERERLLYEIYRERKAGADMTECLASEKERSASDRAGSEDLSAFFLRDRGTGNGASEGKQSRSMEELLFHRDFLRSSEGKAGGEEHSSLSSSLPEKRKVRALSRFSGKKFAGYTVLALFLSFLLFVSSFFLSLLRLHPVRMPLVDAESYDAGVEGETLPESQNGVNIQARYPLVRRTPVDPDVENILVFGVDRVEESDPGRSDAMVICSLNRREQSVKMISLMRDTEVNIKDFGPNKLNAAYALGGVGLLLNTVNETYGMDINKFIQVDLWSSVDLVDALGGVDIEIKDDNELIYTNDILRQMRILHPEHEIPNIPSVGVHRLNGSQAVAFSRNRNSDSDFGRTSRQRIVLEAMMRRLLSFNPVGQWRFFDTLCREMGSNIQRGELIRLGWEAMRFSLHGIQSLRIPEDGYYQDDPETYNLHVDWSRQNEHLHDFIWGHPLN